MKKKTVKKKVAKKSAFLSKLTAVGPAKRRPVSKKKSASKKPKKKIPRDPEDIETIKRLKGELQETKDLIEVYLCDHKKLDQNKNSILRELSDEKTELETKIEILTGKWELERSIYRVKIDAMEKANNALRKLAFAQSKFVSRQLS